MPGLFLVLHCVDYEGFRIVHASETLEEAIGVVEASVSGEGDCGLYCDSIRVIDVVAGPVADPPVLARWRHRTESKHVRPAGATLPRLEDIRLEDFEYVHRWERTE